MDHHACKLPRCIPSGDSPPLPPPPHLHNTVSNIAPRAASKASTVLSGHQVSPEQVEGNMQILTPSFFSGTNSGSDTL